MKNILMLLILGCAFPIVAGEKGMHKTYFELDGHKYLHVAGYCSVYVEYLLHLEDCSCEKGLYQVYDGELHDR